MRWGLLLLAVFSVAGLCGCGPKRPATLAVEGVVTLDGAPVEGAAVSFMPKAGGRPATGATNSQGKFSLMTFKPGDGALPGEHSVTIQKNETSGVSTDPNTGLEGEIAPEGIKIKWIIPEKYSRPDSSGLTFTVERGMTPPKFDLKSAE